MHPRRLAGLEVKLIENKRIGMIAVALMAAYADYCPHSMQHKSKYPPAKRNSGVKKEKRKAAKKK